VRDLSRVVKHLLPGVWNMPVQLGDRTEDECNHRSCEAVTARMQKEAAGTPEPCPWCEIERLREELKYAKERSFVSCVNFLQRLQLWHEQPVGHRLPAPSHHGGRTWLVHRKRGTYENGSQHQPEWAR
jgi:hypothetical protein